MHIFLYHSGGLPAGLRFDVTGLTSPATTGSSTSTTTTPPTSSTSTGQPSNANGTTSSNDPTNYAGVFAQMLNMMSNQNIVSFFFLLFE